MITDDWLYLLLTWRSDQGLLLYINGILKSISTKPVPTNSATSTSSGVFVIGRSVSSEAGYAKFQMTLFTVLKKFASRSESFRLLAYYVGRAITSSIEG